MDYRDLVNKYPKPKYSAERLYWVRRGMFQDLENNWEYEKREAAEHSNLLEPEWSRKQWGEVQQIKGELIHIRKEIAELQNKKPQKVKSKFD